MEEKPHGKITIKLNGQQFREQSQQPALQKERPAAVSKEPERLPEPVSPAFLPHENKEEDALERLAEMRVNVDREQIVKPTAREVDPLPNVFPELSLIEGDDFSGPRSGFPPLRSGSLIKGLLTAFGAVAVGLVFGFLVLAVFTQDEFSQSYRTVLDGTLQTLTSTNTHDLAEVPTAGNIKPDSSSTADQSTFADSNVALKLPQQSFVMAQFGAFQSEEAAKMAIAQLQQQSYPHFLFQENGKQYLYVAAATSRDDILGMASSFKKKGMDIFVKEVKLPNLDKTFTLKQAKGSQNQDPFVSFFIDGLEMAHSLTESSSSVANSAGASMTEAEGAAIKEKHRRFLDESRAFQQPEEWKPLFEGMVTGLNQAITAQSKMAEALIEKNTQKAESYAWQVQAGVLNYLESYAKWVQMVQ